MPVILLYDTPKSRAAHYPLCLTRPVGDLRHGIFTARERWQCFTGLGVYLLSEGYLQQDIPGTDHYLCVDASVRPERHCIDQILQLEKDCVVEDGGGLLAFFASEIPLFNQFPAWPKKTVRVPLQERLLHISDIFKTNAQAIRADIELVSAGENSLPLAPSNTVMGENKIFVQQGAEVQACTINTTEGPVFIGKNALVMEGALIRGPVAIGEGAVVKMGTRLYPGTTIGNYCTAGGEIKNTMMMGYSNKAHDGYLGDAVIGEWCNFGAGSSNSNVKNTGGPVTLWFEEIKGFKPVGNKAGVIMGDYSRCAINSSFNTGTTVGVSCNIFDGSYPDKHLPSFSWGNFERYEFGRACANAANWKKMKGMEFTEADRLILQHLYGKTKKD